MPYRANKSFIGLVSMTKGEVREIDNESLVKSLLRAGLIVDLGDSKSQKATKSSKAKSKREEGGDDADA